VSRTQAEIKLHLLPYGIWYYGAAFDTLVGKLYEFLRSPLYLPPNVKDNLEVLSELKSVEGFEDIGEEIESWRNYISSQLLDFQSCRILYETSTHLREVLGLG